MGWAGVHGFRARDGAAPRNDLIAALRLLLADAEIAEDHIQQILDIDGAGDMAEAAQCQAEIFGAQLGEGRSGPSA